MKQPPIFEICNASAAIKAVFGSGPVRVFPFGEAEQNTPRPYATFQLISGRPENYLDGAPDIETTTYQIDIWADEIGQTMGAANALERELEKVGHIVAYRSTQRDGETGLYRVAFDCQFWL